MRVIGLTEIRNAVLAAIEEKGEHYRYPFANSELQCVYFEEGDEHEAVNSCGVGFALDKLELKTTALELIEIYKRGPLRATVEPSASELLSMFNRNDELDVMFTDAAKRWADCFQQRQDEGAEWGAAAREADIRVGTSEYIGINVSKEPVTVAVSSHSDLYGSMHSTDEHNPNL